MQSISLDILKQRVPPRSPAEWAVLVPFGVFCFVYPFAMLLLSLDLMPFGMEWMSSLLLAMLGLSIGAWLWLNFGAVGASLSPVVFALGLALEYFGVSTGIPFGHYSYTGVLVPGLPGGVPLAIGFAWLFIIGSGLFTARRLLMRLSGRGAVLSTAAVAFTGAVLAVGLDFLLEPVAFHVKGYWLWLDEPAGYYGVPWSNFLSWFVAALLMGFLALLVLRVQRDATLRLSWLPVVLYFMNVLLFGVVNLAHALFAPAVICLVLFSPLYFVRLSESRQG